MKKNEKKMLLILIIVGLIIIGLVFFLNRPKSESNNVAQTNEEFVQVLDDGTKMNISNKLKEAKNLDGLTIQNIELTEKDGQSRLLADVTNNSSADVTDPFFINIILLDKNGNTIDTVTGIVTPVKVGETKKLSAGITEDYANAYDFKVEKK